MEEAKVTENQEFIKVSSIELAKKFAEFKVPDEIVMLFKQGILRMPLNFIKMMTFVDQFQVDNSDLDFYAKLPNRRMEGESKEELNMRSKLSKALYKYRRHIYDYSIFDKQ
mgnify:CR=1 FL=1